VFVIEPLDRGFGYTFRQLAAPGCCSPRWRGAAVTSVKIEGVAPRVHHPAGRPRGTVTDIILKPESSSSAILHGESPEVEVRLTKARLKASSRQPTSEAPADLEIPQPGPRKSRTLSSKGRLRDHASRSGRGSRVMCRPRATAASRTRSASSRSTRCSRRSTASPYDVEAARGSVSAPTTTSSSSTSTTNGSIDPKDAIARGCRDPDPPSWRSFTDLEKIEGLRRVGAAGTGPAPAESGRAVSLAGGMENFPIEGARARRSLVQLPQARWHRGRSVTS